MHSLVCSDGTIDAAFRVDVYPNGRRSYLHLYDFGYARDYDAASAVFRIGEHEAVFLEGFDASLTPYTSTFSLSAEALSEMLEQLQRSEIIHISNRRGSHQEGAAVESRPWAGI